MEKPHYTAENVNVIQNIKALKQELKQLAEDSDACSKNIEELEGIKNKTHNKCLEVNR